MDYIDEAIKKQCQWARANSRDRLFLEQLILQDLAAANRRGYKVYWGKQGILYLLFTSSKVK